MKNLLKLFIVIGLTIPFRTVHAQSKDIATSIEESGEQLGHKADQFGAAVDNVGRRIDKMVNSMVNRWTSPLESTSEFEEDTIEQSSPAPYGSGSVDSDSTAETFSGDKVIEESEIVHGNIEVKGGDLTIFGLVNGDVLVIGGDLHMKRTGKVTGSARVVNGSILKEDGAVIEGFEKYTRREKPSPRPSRSKFSRTIRTFEVPWSDEQMNLDNFIFRYNRVEGLFLGVGSEKRYYWDGEREWNVYGSAGWGFKSHTWRGNLGLSRQFAILTNEGNAIIELGAEGYSLTDTKDKWIISLHENTAAALLMHEDFRNYFQRNGYTIHVAYYSKRDYLKNELKFEYLADSYDSLNNKVDWALFGGGKKFRLNPAIDPGKMRSVIASAGVSTISNTSYGPEGWSLSASAEVARKNWGSASEFDQYIVDLRRFQPLGRYDNFNIRVRAGSLVGDMVSQKMFELGGLGTMNSFPFKSEIGNRMLLVNAELIINGSFLDDLDFWPTWLFRSINFLILSDAGFTRMALPSAQALQGVEPVTFNDFKHDVGVGFSNRSGSFRIGIAWRTDHPSPATFILRFNRPF